MCVCVQKVNSKMHPAFACLLVSLAFLRVSGEIDRARRRQEPAKSSLITASLAEFTSTLRAIPGEIGFFVSAPFSSSAKSQVRKLSPNPPSARATERFTS